MQTVEYEEVSLAMATDTVINQGTLDRETLDSMYASFPDDMCYDDANPLDVVAGVLVIDKLWGVARDDDRLIIHPMYGVWLLAAVRVVGPEPLVARVTELQRVMFGSSSLDSGDDEQDLDELQRCMTTWFTIVFDLTVGDDPTPYHPDLQGRQLTIRFLTEEECERVNFTCATTRADGTLIEAPNSNPSQF